MEEIMKQKVNDAASTTLSRINRRTILRGAAASAAATTLGTVSKRSTFAAPAFLQGTTIVFAVGADNAPKIQPLIDDYASANNVTVEMQPNPFASLLEKLTLNLTQATGAYDVVSMDDPWMPQFAGGEFLMNLEELMDQQGLAPDEDFVPELLALGDYPPGTGLRGIPWVGNVQVYAWRTDVLEDMGIATPKTWDDVLAAAQTITDAKGSEGLYGIGLRGQAGNPAATSFLPVLRGYGTDLFDENWEPQLETPEALAAMTTQLALAKLAPPGVENVGHAENGINMYEGIIAQSGDIWPDQLLQIYDPELSKVVGMVDIGGEPAQEGVAPANMTGNWLLGIPEGSQNAEAALDFILWFTAPEQQLRLLLDQNIPATRTSVLENPEAVEKLPFLPGLLAAGRNALPRPRTPLYNAVEAIYGRYVAEAIAGQVSGEEALASANTEIRDLMVREGVLQQ
jgi:multiple sugar transport system substrate-binding protein